MSRAKFSAEQALIEKARREKARRNLIDYACYVAPFYRPARHHQLVAQKLEAVLRYIESRGREGIGRLMIFEPPRHGKTEQVSRLFPSWVLGKRPDSRVILTSYGADLAQDDSKAVRDYVTGEHFAAVFGKQSTVENAVELSADTRSKSNWDLAEPHRGGVVAAGIGGGITGKGAHLLVIDDPFKNRDEANSEAYRTKVMSWYKSAAYQRLEDGGAIVITHTRWHQDDLAGQLLQTMASDVFLADQWEVVFLPALALKAEDYSQNEEEFRQNLLKGIYLPDRDPLGRKPGEALWPEKYDEGALAKIRANTGEYEFASLDQQQPRPAEGGFFDEVDFKTLDYLPDGLRWFRYVDLALGKTQTSDYNATVATALNPEDGMVIYRDMLRVRKLEEFLKQVKSWMLSEAERGTVWGFEDVAFQTLVVKDFLKDAELANVAIMTSKPEGDKVQRARAIQTRGKQGLVGLKRGSWILEFLNEAAAFPNGQHDDQIDTASGGLALISDKASAHDIMEHYRRLAAQQKALNQVEEVVNA